MSLDDIAKVPDLMRSKAKTGDKILVQWHGGEPTLMGSAFIRSGIQILEREGPEFDWRHGIQTNLMSIDDAWCDLYHEHFGGEVGVSWDPKIRLMNKHAIDSNDAFNKRFEENLKFMTSKGLTPYLVVTAARTLFKNFPNPFDFFQHWLDRGVEHVHLERITETGYARVNWKDVGLTNAEYSRLMSKWYRAYTSFRKSQYGNAKLFLSPFENMADSVASLSDASPRSHGCWSGMCDTRFHTIDADGYKFGCTAITSEQGNKRSNHNLDLGSDLVKIRELRQFDCFKCKFRKICSSGCLAISFDDGSGECSGGYDLFETATILNGLQSDLSEKDSATLSGNFPTLKIEAHHEHK